jgi:hypothetical protein
MNRLSVVGLAAVVVAASAFAQNQDTPLQNWTAPPFWRATVITAKPGAEGQMLASAQGMTASVQSLPSSPLPFVAITPCRIVDTRVNVADGFHEPNFADDETRTFDLPNSPDCTGLPASAGAWSLNVQFRPIAQASYITMFPTGTTRPLVSTTVGTPAGFTTDAAIVPAGTSGDIDVYCQYAGRVVIDINGYYANQSLVSSLNTKTGDLTLAAGSNVTITPSTNTLTIAATGGPGGDLPVGSSSQTLRNNGSSWVASSVLTNDGSSVGISGNLYLPNSTGFTGTIVLGGYPFLHDYAGPGTGGGNTFVGQSAGNFTMGGSNSYDGSYNVGIGLGSLEFNTTGNADTASGYATLVDNTTGYNNTANGYDSMYFNTTGYDNTASGYDSLFHNSTGDHNTAVGFESLLSNTTGFQNAGSGEVSLYSNTTGFENTASGGGSLYSNTTGYDNTATGFDSLLANTTGFDNTTSGFEGLYSNTTGHDDTASGYDSLHSNQTGHDDVAMGASSLAANTTGTYNTAVGSIAGDRSETITAYNGSSVTLVPNTTGNYDTFIGRGTGATEQVDNCTAVGVDAYCTATNQVRLGNYYVTSIGGQVAWSALSDARAKKDIRDLDLGLDLIMKLRPVAYRLRGGDGKTDLGLVAQDVEKVLGDSYNVVDVGGDPQRTLSLRYTELIAPLVKAIQEQQAQIEAKDARIGALEEGQVAQEAEIRAQRTEIAGLKAQTARIDELRRQVEVLIAARDVASPVNSIGN